MIKPQIVQAADAVAYLPLYIAEQGQIALELPDGSALTWDEAFGEPFRSPPDEYLKGVKGDHKRTGDQGCLNAIREAWDSKVPLIGVCDPCNIVDVEDLVVVGGFINRACFWCLTDKDVPAATSPEGLKVSQLFIHDRGFLTGHRIGDQVIERLPKDGDGDPFVVDGSFDLLVDGAIWAKANNADSTVAAISASILSCVLAQDRGFRIAFAMHDLPEYRDFLTTALVVHREALKLHHVRQALKLLVRALAHSQAFAGLWGKAVDEVTRLCNEGGRFTSERRIDCAEVIGRAVVPKNAGPAVLPNITDAQAREVWNALRSIYSEDCDITDVAWDNAIRLSGKLKDGIPPKLQRYYDRSILEEANKARLIDEPVTRQPRLDELWRGVGARGRVRIILSLLALVAATTLLNRFPLWVGISTVASLVLFVLWWIFPFNAGRIRDILDHVVVGIWWVLIILMGVTALAGVIVGWQKEGDNFTDLSKYLGSAGNSHWQWWAARISNGWEATLALLTLVSGALGTGIRFSRAARLLPRWLRGALGGDKA